MDSVPITLKKVVEPPPGILNDEELLTRILEEVRAIKAQKGEAKPKEKLKIAAKPYRPAKVSKVVVKPKKKVTKKEVKK